MVYVFLRVGWGHSDFGVTTVVILMPCSEGDAVSHRIDYNVI